MRREEAYHSKILNPKNTNHAQNEDEIATIHNDISEIDEDLKGELIYDWHPKYSFIDHFSDEKFTLESFRGVSFNEVGDFANQPFLYDKNKFRRDGGIYLDRLYKTSMKKSYKFYNNSIELDYKIKSDFDGELFYGCELNFHFAHPQKITFNSKNIQNGFSEFGIDELLIFDDFTQKNIILKTDTKCDLFAYILNTVSQSENGFDKVAQGVSILFTTPLKKKFKICLELK
jgi:hypothetical protein